MLKKALSILLCVLVALQMPFVSAKHDSNEPASHPSVVTAYSGNVIAIPVNGNKTVMGVIYGNEEIPGCIILFAKFTRSLGIAEIYDSTGVMIGRRAIMAHTFVFQRISHVIEFSDTNGNGVYDSKEDPTQLSVVATRREPVLQWTHLFTSWSINWTRDSDSVLFEFIARNLPVFGPKRSRSMLEEVEIDVYLNFTRTALSTSSLPVYRLVVEPRSRDIVSSSLTGHESARGTITEASFKYDLTLNGWPATSKESRILILTETFFGTKMERETARWVKATIMEKINAYGRAVFNESHSMDAPTSQVATVGKCVRPDRDGDGIPDSYVVRRRIDLIDNWKRMGALSWRENASVDGEIAEVRYCLINAVRGSRFDDSTLYKGLLLVGGYVYPSGKIVHHDPALSVSSVELDLRTDLFDLLPFRSVLFQTVLCATAISIVIFRKRKQIL